MTDSSEQPPIVPPSPAPGWYDTGDGRQQYFDGTQWTTYQYGGVAPAPTPLPAQSSGGNVLGGLSLGLGIGAFVLAWVPLLGLILAVAALALGIIALIRHRGMAGRGLSIAGVIIGGIAAIIAVFWLAIFGAALNSANNASTPSQQPRPPITVPETPPTMSPPSSQPSHGSTLADPFPFGSEIEVNYIFTNYRVVIGHVDWNPKGVDFGVKPGKGLKFIIVPMTIENLDSRSLNPFIEMGVHLKFVSDNGRAYGYGLFAEAPDRWDPLGSIVQTARATGTMVYEVPEDTTDGTWQLRDGFIDATE